MNRAINASYLTLIYLFFYIPIVVLIVYSFNDAEFSLVWHGFTLDWYHSLFSNTNLWIAAWHSLVLGICASSIATVIGTLAAVCLYRYRFFGKKFLYGLLFILILSPDIVMGISLLILFSVTKISLGFFTLLLAHITFCIPFAAVTVYSRLVTINQDIFEAAKDLGANDIKIFTSMVLPLVWPAILAGWLLNFTLSIDDVIVSYFVAGPDYEILPLKIYSMVRFGVKPEVSALCAITFCVTLVLVIISHLTLRKE